MAVSSSPLLHRGLQSGKLWFCIVRNFKAFVSDEEIAVIGAGFLDRTLPKSSWTHAAHFATTLWLIACRKDVEPARDLPHLIRSYNEATGGANTDTEGYHETITQASIRAARAFLAENRATSLFLACNALMSSPLGEPDWLLAYWSRDRLFSRQARRSWVDPDIQPLPF
jgi:hypothetical protein